MRTGWRVTTGSRSHHTFSRIWLALNAPLQAPWSEVKCRSPAKYCLSHRTQIGIRRTPERSISRLSRSAPLCTTTYYYATERWSQTTAIPSRVGYHAPYFPNVPLLGVLWRLLNPQIGIPDTVDVVRICHCVKQANSLIHTSLYYDPTWVDILSPTSTTFSATGTLSNWD